MQFTNGRRVSKHANLQGLVGLCQVGQAAEQSVEDASKSGLVQILDGGQGCRTLAEGVACQHGLVGITPVGVKYHIHISILHAQGEKCSADIKSIRQANPEGISAICERDPKFTFWASLFWKSAKEDCCTIVSWDRSCNPQAASTGGDKLLKTLKLICFYVEWIDDDDLVRFQVVWQMG